jgi:hypothetical protein
VTTTMAERRGPAPAGSAGQDPGPDRRTVARAGLRRWAWPIAIVVTLALAVLVTVVANGRGNSEPLDPAGVAPDGSKALAQVLRTHGVDVETARSPAQLTSELGAHPQAVLLVSRTDLLSSPDVDLLQRLVVQPGRALVLVVPSPAQLARLAPGVTIAGGHDRTTAPARCGVAAAVRAGAADAGGLTFRVESSGGWAGCYPVDGQPSYVTRSVGPPVTIVGQPSLLTNDRLAKQGNASLMLGTLGTTGDLVWFVPGGFSDGAGQHSLSSLLPGWVDWVVLQLFLVVAVCMLWRGRRLGRLVPEPLPVAVRAVETTEGRARMYRRGRAHDRAAAQLRQSEMARLRDRLGLPRSASVADVVAVVAQRTGIPGRDVAELLSGTPPHDDAGLVRLATTLDQLDREVRRP